MCAMQLETFLLYRYIGIKVAVPSLSIMLQETQRQQLITTDGGQLKGLIIEYSKNGAPKLGLKMVLV